MEAERASGTGVSVVPAGDSSALANAIERMLAGDDLCFSVCRGEGAIPFTSLQGRHATGVLRRALEPGMIVSRGNQAAKALGSVN